MVYEDMPHDSCRRSVEVLAVGPICGLTLEHSDVSLVHEGGRLKRMIWPLQLHLVERDPMKVVVDQMNQRAAACSFPFLSSISISLVSPDCSSIFNGPSPRMGVPREALPSTSVDSKHFIKRKTKSGLSLA